MAMKLPALDTICPLPPGRFLVPISVISFENRMLGRIFGPMGVETAGSWRELHNMELHNSYFLLNTITLIKSWWMRGEGYVACMGYKRNR
jgi:hypothetical protein